jgi:hypothetical protein
VTARLLLDEMYLPELARRLREDGHGVLAVGAIPELTGMPDAAVLECAYAEGRCLVTENVRDYAVLAQYQNHCGVLLLHAARWARTRSALPRLHKAGPK